MIRVKVGPCKEEVEIEVNGACDQLAVLCSVLRYLPTLVAELRGGLTADETEALTGRLKGQAEKLKGMADDDEGSTAAGPQPAQ
jgi:hypothetical protein